MNPITPSRMMIAPAMTGFLKRSQKKCVSSATSRDGGGAVGINVVCWISLKPVRSSYAMRRFLAQASLKRAYPRDKPFSDDKILCMNAFWNSFENLMGLGVEPGNLTFVQISLRGV